MSQSTTVLRPVASRPLTSGPLKCLLLTSPTSSTSHLPPISPLLFHFPQLRHPSRPLDPRRRRRVQHQRAPAAPRGRDPLHRHLRLCRHHPHTDQGAAPAAAHSPAVRRDGTDRLRRHVGVEWPDEAEDGRSDASRRRWAEFAVVSQGELSVVVVRGPVSNVTEVVFCRARVVALVGIDGRLFVVLLL